MVAGVATTVAVRALAALWLYGPRLRRHLRLSPPGTATRSPATVTRAAWTIQSGILNDSVTWLILGLACLGGALAFSIG